MFNIIFNKEKSKFHQDFRLKKPCKLTLPKKNFPSFHNFHHKIQLNFSAFANFGSINKAKIQTKAKTKILYEQKLVTYGLAISSETEHLPVSKIFADFDTTCVKALVKCSNELDEELRKI